MYPSCYRELNDGAWVDWANNSKCYSSYNSFRKRVRFGKLNTPEHINASIDTMIEEVLVLSTEIFDP